MFLCGGAIGCWIGDGSGPGSIVIFCVSFILDNCTYQFYHDLGLQEAKKTGCNTSPPPSVCNIENLALHPGMLLAYYKEILQVPPQIEGGILVVG